MRIFQHLGKKKAAHKSAALVRVTAANGLKPEFFAV
jgi:hypothetical protein